MRLVLGAIADLGKYSLANSNPVQCDLSFPFPRGNGEGPRAMCTTYTATARGVGREANPTIYIPTEYDHTQLHE
jgi:hypothetical protein